MKPFACQLLQHDYNQAVSLPRAGLLLNSADLIFADPPYNLGLRYSEDDTGDDLSDADYREFTVRSIRSLAALARPGATFWWMTPEQHADWTGMLLSNLVGPRLYRICWYEKFAQYQGDRALTKDYRFLFVHYIPPTPLSRDDDGKELITFNPDAIREESVRQKMGDKRANPKGRVPGCVWDVRRLQGTSTAHVDWHPCQLPPELLERIVKGWSRPGDLVVDGFAGSGSMGKVCRAAGRDFVGVDKSPTYVGKMRKELGFSD